MPTVGGHATGQTPLAKGQPRARGSRRLEGYSARRLADEDEDGDEDDDNYDWLWENSCEPEFCTSTDGGNGYDCCASMDWGEPATCANGYTPTPSNPSEDDCLYTCCPTEDVDVDAFCRENGFEPDNFDAQRQAYPLEDEFLFGFQSGTCQFVAMEWDGQWATCCCSDPSYCCAWGEDENCKSLGLGDDDDDDDDALMMSEEDLMMSEDFKLQSSQQSDA